MIKPVKRNKRLKWIDSHYAYFYKFRLFIRLGQLSAISFQGKASIKAIKSAPGDFTALKKLAIIKQMVSTTIAINEILKKPVEGRVTK